MGLTRARIRLANARRPDLAAVEVDALADTGALHLSIPEHVAVQLALDELEKREIAIADYRKLEKPKEILAIPDSTYRLAQMRLKALGANGGGAGK